MWFAEFQGHTEYAFLCGPLLHQLQYASEEDAIAFKLQEQESQLSSILDFSSIIMTLKKQEEKRLQHEKEERERLHVQLQLQLQVKLPLPT